jgi:putative flavoprotein involved in K+ transport
MSSGDAEILVVGAGASGLSAAACLTRLGRRPVVLHRDARVGASWRGRYDRLHLHTTRRFSGLPFHPVPRSYGRFVAKDDYARYLEAYADRLGLDVRGGSRSARSGRSRKRVPGASRPRMGAGLPGP